MTKQEYEQLKATGQRPPIKRQYSWKVAVGIGLGIAVGAAMLNSKPTVKLDPATALEREQLTCTNAVRQNLRTPKVAEFVGYPQVLMNKDQSQGAIVVSVDSQNAFGAMLRKAFACRFVRNGNDWVLTSVEEG